MSNKKQNFNYDISVIIPVYNVEKFLAECLDSLINQTYDFNKIEVVLINDGSKDNSLEICNNYASKYPNIKVIDKVNEGVSIARNTGIKEATGKYIMILDSDDFISKETIENLYNFYEEHYNEIDLLTYPIHFYTLDKKTSLHPRYKAYDKGSGIYDIEEYIYLNQSTVNIMFKNEKDLFYDATMKLSEDQKFDTQLIMRKKKIGFCQNAIYYYRRHGGGVSQNINSMIYCFESIVSYNEWLIKTYTKKGILPKYIQSLIINTINWRITSNQLIPYQYENEEFDKAFSRIVNLIKHVDNDVIINLDNMELIVKGYLLKLKEEKFNLDFKDNKVQLKVGNLALEDTSKLPLYLTNFYFRENKLYINGFFNTNIFENFKPKVIMTLTQKDGNKKDIECELKYSRWSEKLTKFKTANLYRIEKIIEIDKIKSIELKIKNKNKTIGVEIKNKHTSTYIAENSQKYALIDKKKIIKILNKNILNKTKIVVKKRLKYLRSNPKFFLRRNVYMPILPTKETWIYMDRRGILDNGYYQFKHDFNKNDGIKRYYVYDENISNIKGKFTEKEQKYLVKFKSLKHRILFVNCYYLISSFCDEPTYSPFGMKNYRYLDIIKHKLIYLQHGVLHANLQLMYGKEFTNINKFVISTNFEEKNLKENYLYTDEDLIKSGMPRLDEKQKEVATQNKIIFAPTWRSYLIGKIVGGKRALFEEKFINSNYYKKINEVLHNEKLIKKLEEKNIILDFKLHPIFKGYEKTFDIKSKNIILNFDNTNLGEYKLFITDFSSYQFDYIKYNRPILYFLPDQLEFKGGLHSYSELDLKYEDAFGDAYYEVEKFTNRIIEEIENDFKNSSKYSNRMKDFFYSIKNCQEKLYEELIRDRKVK